MDRDVDKHGTEPQARRASSPGVDVAGPPLAAPSAAPTGCMHYGLSVVVFQNRGLCTAIMRPGNCRFSPCAAPQHAARQPGNFTPTAAALTQQKHTASPVMPSCGRRVGRRVATGVHAASSWPRMLVGHTASGGCYATSSEPGESPPALPPASGAAIQVHHANTATPTLPRS